jgi:F-type H+-transporting ATPase subunit epsilon
MAVEFILAVAAPDREVLDAPVIAVNAPGVAGYFGVLAGHEPTVAALKPGLVEYVEPNGTRHFVNIAGGFAEVTSTRVTILADAAERAQDIDVARASAALERARAALRGEDEGMSQQEAVLAIERASARLRAAKGAHS